MQLFLKWGVSYVESYLLTYSELYVKCIFMYFTSACSLAAVLWPSLCKTYLPISLPSCFTAADFTAPHHCGPQICRWLLSTKPNIAVFSSPSRREKLLFSARGSQVLLPLSEGYFVWGLIMCIGVERTKGLRFVKRLLLWLITALMS